MVGFVINLEKEMKKSVEKIGSIVEIDIPSGMFMPDAIKFLNEKRKETGIFHYGYLNGSVITSESTSIDVYIRQSVLTDHEKVMYKYEKSHNFPKNDCQLG